MIRGLFLAGLFIICLVHSHSNFTEQTTLAETRFLPLVLFRSALAKLVKKCLSFPIFNKFRNYMMKPDNGPPRTGLKDPDFNAPKYDRMRPMVKNKKRKDDYDPDLD
ncbi:hypothetical protein Ciccas_004773 [Cichlidogyrus casuarinus]|uniref:Uncharacterized protein n=1 Tax=Cichlidogyrus casuarinus TaxID=1844966 RepID=A0ABD2QAJ0_9PLAT